MGPASHGYGEAVDSPMSQPTGNASRTWPHPHAGMQAIAVRLIDRGVFRVGGEQYAADLTARYRPPAGSSELHPFDQRPNS